MVTENNGFVTEFSGSEYPDKIVLEIYEYESSANGEYDSYDENWLSASVLATSPRSECVIPLSLLTYDILRLADEFENITPRKYIFSTTEEQLVAEVELNANGKATMVFSVREELETDSNSHEYRIYLNDYDLDRIRILLRKLCQSFPVR